MIVLVTSNEHATKCAAALEQATGEPIVIADSLARATTLLRADCYEAVVFDENIFETEPQETEIALEHLGTAIPVYVNSAITGIERMVREVRYAVRRRKREHAIAREAATRSLYGELNSTLTTLLLQCELALGTDGVPAAAAERLASVQQAAQKLRSQLAPGEASAGTP